jgi:hypothetical protein
MRMGIGVNMDASKRMQSGYNALTGVHGNIASPIVGFSSFGKMEGYDL